MNGGHRGRSSEEGETSFVQKHNEMCHKGMDMDFRARVTKQNTDSLSRQVREGVYIRRETRTVLNSKSEWFQPSLFRVRSEIVRE